MSLRADLGSVVAEVSALYHERDVEARMIAVGILARQHVLLLGPPGTAKSAIVRELTSRITGGEYWEVLLHKFIAPSAIFGPIDLAALVGDNEHRQILEGHATTAHVAFLDEIFKCSASALNSMLAFLNERLYHPESGGRPIACPLISAVAASNELGEDETTAALDDRLLLRMQVEYLDSREGFDALLSSAVAGTEEACPRTTIDLSELQHASVREVPAVGLPVSVREAIRDLRADLRHREIVASDRRWKQSVRVLQAAAWLAGRDQVAVDDLLVLEHVLWQSPASRTTVSRVVRSYLSPDDRELFDLADAAGRIRAELAERVHAGDPAALRDWAIETNPKLANLRQRIDRLASAATAAGRSVRAHQQALEEANDTYTRMLVEALGVDESTVAASLQGGGTR